MDGYRDLILPQKSPETPASVAPAMEHYKAFFIDYFRRVSKACPRDPAPLRLKLEHSLRVLDNAAHIAGKERFDAATTRACMLSALLHDIARFEQYRVWGTFRDQESCDHGALSAQLLRKADALRRESGIADCVLQAIALHNKQELPPGIGAMSRTVACVLRDSDRIDIMRVIAGHLLQKNTVLPDVIVPFADDPALFSQPVIDCIMQKRPCSYALVKSANDFRLLVSGWFYLLEYPSARGLCARSGSAQSLIQKLSGPYAAARDRLQNDLMASARST